MCCTVVRESVTWIDRAVTVLSTNAYPGGHIHYVWTTENVLVMAKKTPFNNLFKGDPVAGKVWKALDAEVEATFDVAADVSS